MSYTPGPWSYEEPDWDGLPHLMAANGDAVATFFSEPKNSRDIPLIAAAPELYEALFELWDKVWRIVDLHRDSEARAEANMALERANTALAKALGEEGEEDA